MIVDQTGHVDDELGETRARRAMSLQGWLILARARADTVSMSVTGRLRRATLRALAFGLCLSALAAIFALVSGSFVETDVRVIVTGLGFSVLSATAGAGGGLRLAASRTHRLIGAATVISSGAAFALLLIAVWLKGSLSVWRAISCLSLLSLLGSHASLVLRGRRLDDTWSTEVLLQVSLITAVLDTCIVLLPLLGLVDQISASSARAFAAVVVVTLLTTLLPPLLRRLRSLEADPVTIAATQEATSGLTD